MRRGREEEPMPLLDTLKGWWAHDASGAVVHDLAAAAITPAGDAGAPCTAGLHYFRLWLAEMRVARDKEWFATRHPAVHALVRLRFGDDTVDLPTIAGPMSLPGLDQAHLGDVMQFDYPLTPLLPYNGGVVEVAAGLVALEGSNVLGEFVRAIETVASVLAQPPLSTALAAVGPVTSAVQTLFGAGNGRQHLGVHVAYAGVGGPQALHAGYLAVVRRAAGPVDGAALTVDGGRLRLQGQPLNGADSLLFRIERMDERDDWDSLVTIARPFKDALTALAHRVPRSDARRPTACVRGDQTHLPGGSRRGARPRAEQRLAVGRDGRGVAGVEPGPPGATESVVPAGPGHLSGE
jgi:hypothetical protein